MDFVRGPIGDEYLIGKPDRDTSGRRDDYVGRITALPEALSWPQIIKSASVVGENTVLGADQYEAAPVLNDAVAAKARQALLGVVGAKRGSACLGRSTDKQSNEKSRR